MDITEHTKSAMANAHKARVEAFGTPISDELYKVLRDYADIHNIRISGFRNYVGDIDTIKTVIDDISEIISESFSGYYSRVGNEIANAFVNRCLAVRKAGDQNEGL